MADPREILHVNVHWFRAVLPCSVLALLAGCSVPVQQTVTTTANAPLALHGAVHGGQQPVVGASVQLYAVGTGGDYSAATAMLSPAAVTDGNGGFNITGKYTCGSATEVYLVATGGIPGGSLVNANLAMMAALGTCASLSASTTVNINELTTVAAAAALRTFMSGPTKLGSSAYDASALLQDFTLANELVSTAAGASPGVNVPSGFSVPSSLVNTLGNILAACVNSSGTAAGSGSPCSTLFTLTTPQGGVAPTDTITALLTLLNHPTSNTTGLYQLITPDAPFAPALAAAPASYQVQLAPPPFTITRQFLVEPDDGLTALYSLINNAASTIDMTIYGLKDTVLSGDMVAACQRGVVVRVIMDQNDEKSVDTAAYNQLNAQAGCSAVWANTKYPATHQKSFVVDGAELAMLTLNLETTDYPGTRDFAILTNDPVDVAAVEATFNADYAMTYPYATTPGNDLIWSPTTAQTSLVSIINNATQSLLVENEEMSASNIVSALEAACQRGVTVNVAMTNQTEYHTDFAALEAAGCGVHVYADSTKVIYIHAKTILADYGTAAQYAYVGSINFSTASMVENRELGMFVYDSPTLQRLDTILAADYAGAPAY